MLLKSQTSTGYFSNSTGSSVTNRRFFLKQWLGVSNDPLAMVDLGKYLKNIFNRAVDAVLIEEIQT